MAKTTTPLTELRKNAPYTIAGLGLADKRMVSAYQEQIGACDRLLASLRCESTTARLLAKGAVLCAELPRAANDEVTCRSSSRPIRAGHQPQDRGSKTKRANGSHEKGNEP
jgi:hypothetical protein